MVAQDRWSLNTSGHKTGFTVLDKISDNVIDTRQIDHNLSLSSRDQTE